MPGDTLYVKNLQIESNTSASGNGFSSTGYGNLTYDGTEILGSSGVGNWTKDGTSIYYDGGNVGIQNTNPQHALSIGSPSNVFINTSSAICMTVSKDAYVAGQIYTTEFKLTDNPDNNPYFQIYGTPTETTWLNSSPSLFIRHEGGDSANIALNGGTFNVGSTIHLDNPSLTVDTNSNTVGIQNTNPQHALSIGNSSNLFFDTTTNELHVANSNVILCENRTAEDPIGSIILRGNASSGYSIITGRGPDGAVLYLRSSSTTSGIFSGSFDGGSLTYTSHNKKHVFHDGLVGIQNTNPQHALSIGNSSNLFFDTTTNELHVANSGVIICKSRQDQTAPIGSIVLEGNASSQYAVITATGINGSALYLQNQNQLGATIYSDSSSQYVEYYSSFNKHVFGSNQNVGIQNTNPQHALTIGSPSKLYVDTTTGIFAPGIRYDTGSEANVISRISSTGELIDFGLLPSFIAYSNTSTLNSSGGSLLIENCFPQLFNNSYVKSYTICFRAIRTSGTNGYFGFRVIDTNGTEYTTGYNNGPPDGISTDDVNISSHLSSTSCVFNIKIVKPANHYDFSGLNCARTAINGNDNRGFIISCSLPRNVQMSSIRLRYGAGSDSFNIYDFKTIAHSTV